MPGCHREKRYQRSAQDLPRPAAKEPLSAFAVGAVTYPASSAQKAPNTSM